MAKFLLFISLLLNFINLSAQTVFNKAYHDKNEKSNPFVVEIFGDTYFATTNITALQVGKSALYKHNNAGTLKFNSNVLGYYVPSHAYKTMDNKLLIVGKNSVCDVIGPTQVNFISKIDTNGNSIFFTTYTITSGAGNSYKTSLQYTDSSYYSFTDSVLFKNSKTGAFVSKTNTGLNSISSSLLLANNSILLSAKQGTITSLITVSSTGATLTSKPFSMLLTKLVFYNSQKILGFGNDGKLYKISPAFDLISSSAFTNNAVINDFQTKNDSVYSILSTTLASSNYLISDTTFNTLLLNSTTTNSLTQSAICLNANKVCILSDGVSKTSFSWPGNHYFVSLNQINKTASNNFTQDIAILSVTKDSIYAAPDFFNVWYTHLKAKVKVKNVGSSVITSFKLNCYMDPRVDCGAYYYQEKFSQLSLAPNDSIEVTTGSFIAKRLVPFASPTATMQYCFFTSVPNEEADKTLENHNMCKTFTVSTITSLNELNGFDNSLTLYPNPFENTISLNSETEMKKADFFNNLGMLIDTKIINNKTYSYTGPNLAPGIYFIKVETEKGTQIKKVVKQ